MIADIKAAVAGRETEILDGLGIRWRDARPHIRCPYLAHLDKRPSWRSDAQKHVAFCTYEERAQSIFDIIIRTGDFARAANRAAEILGPPDLIRGDKKTSRREPADDASWPGLSLAEYAAAKALPEDFLRQLGFSDTTYARLTKVQREGLPGIASGSPRNHPAEEGTGAVEQNPVRPAPATANNTE